MTPGAGRRLHRVVACARRARFRSGVRRAAGATSRRKIRRRRTPGSRFGSSADAEPAPRLAPSGWSRARNLGEDAERGLRSEKDDARALDDKGDVSVSDPGRDAGTRNDSGEELVRHESRCGAARPSEPARMEDGAYSLGLVVRAGECGVCLPDGLMNVAADVTERATPRMPLRFRKPRAGALGRAIVAEESRAARSRAPSASRPRAACAEWKRHLARLFERKVAREP